MLLASGGQPERSSKHEEHADDRNQRRGVVAGDRHRIVRAEGSVGSGNELLTAGECCVVGLSWGVTRTHGGKPMAVPVEDVLLVVNDKLALMVGGADGKNNPANIASDGVIEFGRGGYVAVLAYGLTPGKTGEVVIMSTPKLLKSLKVADDGKLAAQAQVPKDLAPGAHTVVVTVGDQAASLGFRVLSSKTATGNSTRTLPATGSDTSMLPLVALVLAVGGVAVLPATRRRKES